MNQVLTGKLVLSINNLKNIGFFEEFESIIKSNNDEGILPQIDNIESIESDALKCLKWDNSANWDADMELFGYLLKNKDDEE